MTYTVYIASLYAFLCYAHWPSAPGYETSIQCCIFKVYMLYIRYIYRMYILYCFSGLTLTSPGLGVRAHRQIIRIFVSYC